MKGDNLKLQNSKNAKNEEFSGYSWYFLVDTCEALAPYTGATGCEPKAKVHAMMNEFIVTTKTVTQFFSEKTFINNDHKLDAEIEVERFILSRSQGTYNSYKI